MDFWRGEAYSSFFEHLDRAGGFYYEVCFSIVHRGNYLHVDDYLEVG